MGKALLVGLALLASLFLALTARTPSVRAATQCVCQYDPMSDICRVETNNCGSGYYAECDPVTCGCTCKKSCTSTYSNKCDKTDTAGCSRTCPNGYNCCDLSSDQPCGREFNQANGCSDGLDNDCDGKIDCNDLDCSDNSTFLSPCSTTNDYGCTRTSCPAGYNCCSGGQNCGKEVDCSDGLDNDCDGKTDAEDIDCGPGACAPGNSCTQTTYNGQLDMVTTCTGWGCNRDCVCFDGVTLCLEFEKVLCINTTGVDPCNNCTQDSDCCGWDTGARFCKNNHCYDTCPQHCTPTLDGSETLEASNYQCIGTDLCVRCNAASTWNNNHKECEWNKCDSPAKVGDPCKGSTGDQPSDLNTDGYYCDTTNKDPNGAAHCCPNGQRWDKINKKCVDAPLPCYDPAQPLAYPCNYPYDDPNLGRGQNASWWNDPDCVKPYTDPTSKFYSQGLGAACCPTTNYGQKTYQYQPITKY